MDRDTFEKEAIEALKSTKKGRETLLDTLGQTPESIISDGVTLEWVVGGVEGNSYQETSRGYPVAGEAEPEDVHLDAILLRVTPTLPFHQYKALLKSVIKRSEHRQNDYYGDYTDIARKAFTLQDLHAHLVDLGALTSP